METLDFVLGWGDSCWSISSKGSSLVLVGCRGGFMVEVRGLLEEFSS